MSEGLGTGSRLWRLIQAPPAPARAPEEGCDLCAEPLPPAHRHLLDVGKGALHCACRACATLFDRAEAGGRHYRLVPERHRELVDLALDDPAWERLGIPVETAFFVRSTRAGRVVAFYPSPVGPMESLLDLRAWEDLVAANPILGELEPDVEALLVHRGRGAREHWLVPVDACYRLVAVIRTHWKGLGGGRAVWSEIAHFFAALREPEGRWQSRRT
jgi:uncharacterized protein DUF5947